MVTGQIDSNSRKIEYFARTDNKTIIEIPDFLDGLDRLN